MFVIIQLFTQSCALMWLFKWGQFLSPVLWPFSLWESLTICWNAREALSTYGSSPVGIKSTLLFPVKTIVKLSLVRSPGFYSLALPLTRWVTWNKSHELSVPKAPPHPICKKQIVLETYLYKALWGIYRWSTMLSYCYLILLTDFSEAIIV